MEKLPVGKIIAAGLVIGLALLVIFYLRKKNRREEILDVMERTTKFFGKLLPTHTLRVDSVGNGGYDPVAQGGTRPTKKHNGVDLVVVPGAVVYSPINGKIVRVAYPYKSEPHWQGVLLEGTQEHKGISFKIFYIVPDADLIGKEVSKGDRIGIAQEISRKYRGAKDHIHVELFVENEHQDPTKALFA